MQLQDLLLTIVLYLIISSAFGVVLFLLGWLPIVGWLLQLIGAALDLYCLVGMILAIVQYRK